jgi:hypothetical protein
VKPVVDPVHGTYSYPLLSTAPVLQLQPDPAEESQLSDIVAAAAAAPARGGKYFRGFKQLDTASTAEQQQQLSSNKNKAVTQQQQQQQCM